MKKSAEEKFEQNIDNMILENATSPTTYWKIMKMLIKSNKGSSDIPPHRDTVFNPGDDDICVMI